MDLLLDALVAVELQVVPKELAAMSQLTIPMLVAVVVLRLLPDLLELQSVPLTMPSDLHAELLDLLGLLLALFVVLAYLRLAACEVA